MLDMMVMMMKMAMMIAHHTVGHDGDDDEHDAEASNGDYDDHF